MKNFLHYRLFVLVLLMTSFSNVFAQQKKERIRLSLNSFSVDESHYLQVLARFKGENGYEGVPGITLQFSQLVAEDSLVSLGEAQTNTEGIARFDLQNKRVQVNDTSFTFTYNITFEGDDRFRSADSEITVTDLILTANLEIKDSIPTLIAQLTDKETGLGLDTESVKIRLKRLFKPLTIGGDMLFTDDEGSVETAIPAGLPGENGKLQFEVVLDEHDTYGTVIRTLTTDLGTLPTDQSTFDNRELWSPAAKTPIFMLIFPNLIIFGIWFVIVLSFRNLLLIRKFNNNENS